MTSTVPRLSEIEVTALFRDIYMAKKNHALYRDHFIKKPEETLISMLREKWGSVTTYMYETTPINYARATQNLLLAKLITERYLLFKYRGRLKNLTVAIVGAGGSGKTTYSVLSAMGALRMLRADEEFIERAVLAFTFFEPTRMVRTIKDLVERRRWTPFIIVDDVGSQISKYWIFLGQHFWSQLFSVLDQVKDWTGTLIMTAKSMESIPARLRDLVDVVIEAREIMTASGIIIDVFEYYRAEEYGLKRTRTTKLKYMIYLDVMSPVAKIPDNIWNQMMEMRRATGLRRIELTMKGLELLPILELKRLEKLAKKAEQGGDGEE